jgi:glycosyltransferase involved in cell wall biosynthesis
MNIGIFVDAYIPVKNGVVTSVVQLQSYLEAQGHRVYVFTASAKHAPVMPNVYRFFSVGLIKSAEVRYALVNLPRLEKIVKPLKLDIIHTHSEFSLAASGKFIAKKYNIPMVHTTHTLWSHYKHYVAKGMAMKMLNVDLLMKLFLKKYRYIISPSMKAMNEFKSMCHPTTKFRLIPNGVDSKLFLKQATQQKNLTKIKLGFLPDDKIALFVGRVGPEKRVKELVETFIPQLQKNAHYKLVIVGDGKSIPGLKKLVTKANLTNQVILTGFINWEHIANYYLISDAFVTVSLSEVMPMTMIEALIAGLPLFARDDDAYRDMIKLGINGSMALTDEAVIADVIALFNNPNQQKEFRESSQALSKIFSVENHSRAVLSFYEAIVAEYQMQNKN